MTDKATSVQARPGIFASIEDFIRTWNDECEKTETLYKAIPEDLWNIKIIPNYRTLGRLAWHITETPREALERADLDVDGPEPHSAVPQSPSEILDMHRRVWKSVAKEIQSQWKDATLKQSDFMYTEQWTRSMTLTMLVQHMIHHRAQMTVLLRAAGEQVPGMYGPSLEEWAAIGIPAPQEI